MRAPRDKLGRPLYIQNIPVPLDLVPAMSIPAWGLLGRAVQGASIYCELASSLVSVNAK